MSSGGAYGTRASDTDFRKKWDKEEYAEKAKQKDLEERERMQENEERLKQGRPAYCQCVYRLQLLTMNMCGRKEAPKRSQR